ncbi:MAG: aminotransferase class I/II-fold pyridoxal phosphate-dependent enzyme [Planctomycetota bacterium]|jgi:cystathionine beta-lyase/cystathionine gamma-synthase
MSTPLRFSTLAVHAGRRPSPADPDVSPPLRRSTAFLQHPDVHAQTDAGDWSTPLVYSRYGSPNVADAEEVLAALEGAERAVLFASGMAAIHAMLMHALPDGKGVVAVARQIYGGTTALLSKALAPLGFEVHPFDVRDEDSLSAALDAGARLVHVEGLSNPTAVVADLPRLAAQAHAAGALLSVDSTFATPVVQRPLEHGADLVVHSATKALAGHSDVTAGVVLGDAARMEAVAGYRKVTGAILDPAAAWLLRRSIATLGLRVEAQCRSAQALAEALSARPEVSRVHYPGLPADPGHGLARRMLAPGLFGSVLAFELADGDAAARPLVARLELAADAPSLGGVETLVSIPHLMSHVGLSPAEREAVGFGPGCVRVACGIEDPRDLVEDFTRALGAG